MLHSRISPLLVALIMACAAAASADVFQNGEFVTYDQNLWGTSTLNPGAMLLLLDYTSVCAGSAGVLTVGLPNTGFTLSFDDSSVVFAFLPVGGPPAPLNNNYFDPSTGTTISGSPPQLQSTSFAGDVLALQLNVDFNNAGFLHGTSNTPFGNLILTNLNSVVSGLDGLTVIQLLGDANTCLGGGSCVYSPAYLDAVATALSLAFDDGVVSSFAQNSLALPTSAAVPEPSSLLLLIPGVLGLAWSRRFKRDR